MILVGLGSNVSGPWGTPRETVERALAELDRPPCRVLEASRLMSTSPMGVRDQPDFVNAVAAIETALEPAALLDHLHDLELEADRRRSLRWGPRTLDLDLIDYDGRIIDAGQEVRSRHGHLTLPHPGIAGRPFVLEPIAEIAPGWRHPVTGKSAAEMLAALAEGTEGSERPGGRK